MNYVTQISDQFVESYRGKTPPWGPVGYIVYKRTYARKMANGRSEEWVDTLKRCCNGILQIGGAFTQEEIEGLFDSCFNLKCSFSGRALWQLGTETVQRVGGDSLNNCWNVAINEPIDPFIFAFDQLMLGGGVGFNISKEHVYSLPIVKHKISIVRKDESDVGFIVPDNREGWVELLKRVLKAAFFTGRSFTYSTVCIRGKGTLIKSFGGKASGPEELVEGINKIVEILNATVGRKLRPVDCLDILNIIGSIVVAGNVRRSAQIAIGNHDDSSFLRAKRWDLGQIPNWRSMSNNSVSCDTIEELPDEFWDGYHGNGEALGLVNIKAARKYGRIVDGENYRYDPQITGFNPCGEIGLANYEPCNLGEIFLPNIRNLEDFLRVSGLMYKVLKTITSIRYSYPRTNDIVKQNRRLGLGVTGYLQSEWREDSEVFNTVYRYLEESDEKYSKILGINKSIKLTTVKPSGTLSLLAGVSPGGHATFAPYYIRRIRFAANDPMIKDCYRAGYHIEPVIRNDGTRDLDTMVIDFPIKTPTEAICSGEMLPVDQIEVQKFLQTYWSDNAVSVTHYYEKGDLPAIQERLREYYPENIKSISFLLHQGHGFVQAPLEQIDEAKYNELSYKTKPITKITDSDIPFEIVDSEECTTGTCPLK